MYSVRMASVSEVSIGRNIQVVEPRNLLVLECLAGCGPSGQNQLAVGKHVRAGTGIA